jgi:hypothetical protein
MPMELFKHHSASIRDTDLFLLLNLCGTFLALLFLALTLLQQRLRDKDLVLSWYGPASPKNRQGQHNLSAKNKNYVE